MFNLFRDIDCGTVKQSVKYIIVTSIFNGLIILNHVVIDLALHFLNEMRTLHLSYFCHLVWNNNLF